MQITLATKFTIARIFLIIPTVIIYILGIMLGGDCYLPLVIISAILFAVLCATDFIDGHIARSTNTVSDLGKFLDPLADKVVIVIMLFLIVFFRDGLSIFAGNGLIIALLSGIILSRELMISVFRSIVARKGAVLAADIYGKIKTVFLDVGVVFLMLAGTHFVMAWIGTIIFYIGALLTIYSGFNYIIKNKHVFAAPDAVVTGSKSDSDTEVSNADTEVVKTDCDNNANDDTQSEQLMAE